LSFGDDFAIQDEAGNDAFFVDGRVFSWGDKLSMHRGGPGGAGGEEVAFIAQKMLSWGPTYEIYRGGELFAVVKKELFTFFNCRFSVDVPGPDDYEARGDFFDHEYAFTRSGRTVAQVSKKYFSWTDTYGIDVVDGEDDVTILAASVVIDMCCHGDKRR
jgi:uncharacterized protein YxjI